MPANFYTFASAEAGENGGLLGALGIDWMTLILQIIAFTILVIVLAKFVYPPLLAMLNRRDKLVEDSVKAAKQAKEEAEKSEEKTAQLLQEARSEAQDIVKTAREESQQIVVDAESDAMKKADAIVASARAQLDQDVEKARQMIRGEAATLVARATEHVVREKVDAKSDAKLIETAIEETN